MSRWVYRRSRAATAVAATFTAFTLLVGCGSTATTSAADTGTTVASTSASSPSGSPATPTTTGPSPASQSQTPTATSPTDTTTGAASYPVTITTTDGKLTVSAQPTSIVSLSPTATEMLYAVGAGKQVIAVDKDSDYPTTGLPSKRIDAFNLNLESLAALHPDLVITTSLSPQQATKFSNLKIPVYVASAPANLDGTYLQIEQTGELTGHAAAAKNLVAGMKKKVARIVAEATANPPASYYYELDQTLYSQTSATFLGSVLGQLGLKSIADAAPNAAKSGGYPQLSAEYILKKNPDYIFLADTTCCHQTPKTVAARPGWSTLAAVKAGRVIALNDDIASRWGPRIVDLMQAVVTAEDKHPVGR